MGIVSLFLGEVKWSLTSLDDGTVIEGQFRPEGLTEAVSAHYSEQSTIGHSQPVLQFVKNNLDKISFQATCWAYSQGLYGTTYGKSTAKTLLGVQTNIEDHVKAIKGLVVPDPALGRPHVYLFTVGEHFDQQVVVSKVGGIRYGEFRPLDGSFRGVTFEIELLRYVDIVTGSAESESLIYRAKTEEFYETITNNLYRNPLLGEALRRRNPDRRHLIAGDQVHVPRERILADELDLTPQCVPLADTTEVKALTLQTFDKRAGPYVSTLPEGF